MTLLKKNLIFPPRDSNQPVAFKIIPTPDFICKKLCKIYIMFLIYGLSKSRCLAETWNNFQAMTTQKLKLMETDVIKWRYKKKKSDFSTMVDSNQPVAFKTIPTPDFICKKLCKIYIMFLIYGLSKSRCLAETWNNFQAMTTQSLNWWKLTLLNDVIKKKSNFSTTRFKSTCCF